MRVFVIFLFLLASSNVFADPYSYYQIQRITLAINSPELKKTFSSFESITSIKEDAQSMTVTINSEARDNGPLTKCERIVKVKIVDGSDPFFPKYELENVSARICVAP